MTLMLPSFFFLFFLSFKFHLNILLTKRECLFCPIANRDIKPCKIKLDLNLEIFSILRCYYFMTKNTIYMSEKIFLRNRVEQK